MSLRAADHVATGLNYLRAGHAQAAIEAFDKALMLDPTEPDALHLSGIIAFQAGATATAITFIQNAIKARPNFADAHSNLGSVLIAAGRQVDAEQALRQAVALNDTSAVYRFNLGNVLAAQKKLDEAIAQYEIAIQHQPEYPEAWSNLGTAYRDLENLAAATRCYEQAVAQRPTYEEARYNLANAYRDQMRLSAAENEIRKVIALNPDNAKAHNALGNILSDSARSAEALTSFEQAAQLAPHALPFASNALSCLQYVPGITDDVLAAAHMHWVGAHNDIFTAPTFRAPNRDANRILNVGFVSSDLGHHPCGFLSVGLFEHLNHSQINPIVFSNRAPAREDHISRRISAVTDWRRTETMTDAELVAMTVDSHVDILIDMNGHTSGHRLGLFARKPALIQMTWLGYVGSTGLPTMDYIIADRWHAPEGVNLTGPEKILRLDDGYTCYEPLADAGNVGPLPALKNGYVTFGSLNNAAKLNSNVIRSYAAILRAVPHSRMVLAFRGLDDAGVKRHLLDLFANDGIEATRIDIRGYAPHQQFLANYHDIDIALDTAPYSGGLTTCEALWMGVPVVTFPGATFAGRHSTSYMSNVGLAEFIASDHVSFEHLAIAKAQDIAALATLRLTLRERVITSPLGNATQFATSFTSALRQAWQSFCSAT